MSFFDDAIDICYPLPPPRRQSFEHLNDPQYEDSVFLCSSCEEPVDPWNATEEMMIHEQCEKCCEKRKMSNDS